MSGHTKRLLMFSSRREIEALEKLDATIEIQTQIRNTLYKINGGFNNITRSMHYIVALLETLVSQGKNN